MLLLINYSYYTFHSFVPCAGYENGNHNLFLFIRILKKNKCKSSNSFQKRRGKNKNREQQRFFTNQQILMDLLFYFVVVQKLLIVGTYILKMFTKYSSVLILLLF